MTRGLERISSGRPSAILHPVVEDDDSAAKVHDHLHVVFDQENPDALFAHLADKVHELSRFFEAQSRGGFIQQQKARPQGQGAADLQALLNPQGQIPGQIPGEGEDAGSPR